MDVVGLLDLDPDLGEGLPEAELRQARVTVQATCVAFGAGVLEAADLAALPVVVGELFAVVVVDGLVVRETQLGDSVTTQLYGPGDQIGVAVRAEDPLPAAGRLVLHGRTRLALLDDRALRAILPWPRLLTRLFERSSAQAERALLHHAIAQLPRVEDRLVAVLWHLADRWGRVRAGAVVVDLPLTHADLGRLIGARRPTVSLGLDRLAKAGVLVRGTAGEWVLSDASAQRLAAAGAAIPRGRRPRPAVPEPVPATSVDRAALRARLRAVTAAVGAQERAVGDTARRSRELTATSARLLGR